MKFLINPNQFNSISDKLFKPFVIISIILTALGLTFAFYLSPEDYQQGSTVRIMYIHVPSACFLNDIFDYDNLQYSGISI